MVAKCEFGCGKDGVEVLELRDNQTGVVAELVLCLEHTAEVRANANQKPKCKCGCSRAEEYCDR